MANYSTSEILNELARIFRARLTPGREGGTLNTQQEYEQLLEISSLTLLLQNDAIFYLDFLASNKLSSIVSQEIDLIEDILVSLEDLSQIGEEVTDTTTLSNATTALLTLDAADSVKGRPETTRFLNLMDKFSEKYRKNVVSRTTSNLVRPREDARNIIQVDFTRLEGIHNKLLTSIFPLRDLLDSFIDLDIPSKVSITSLTRIRENLNALSVNIEDSTSVENIARSRQDLLTSLASKVGVELIAEFSDPRTVKIRSPRNPIPSTAKHFGRVTGEGEPASVISGPAPWDLPVSAPLDLSINKGATQSVLVDEIIGSVLNGRNDESFTVTTAYMNLNVIVDPRIHNDTVSSGSISTASLVGFVDLGFKHLGVPVNFQNLSGSPSPDDYQPRVITELGTLQTATVSVATDLGNETYQLTLTGWSAGFEAGTGLGNRHVGRYFLQGSKRFEILEAVDGTPNSTIVSVPTVQPTPVVPTTGGVSLNGCVPAATSRIVFTPSLTVSASGPIQIGAAVKTVQFTTGPQTVADLIDDVESLQSNHDAGFSGGAALQTLNHHVKALPVAGDPTKLALMSRSFFNPHVQISSTFLKVAAAVGDVQTLVSSAHILLGFREGEFDTNKLLTASELVGAITDAISSVEAEVVETELGAGANLSSLNGQPGVQDTTINFNDLVIAGDQIEIITGVSAIGTYRITTVGATILTLDRDDFTATESGLRYRLFREQVKISTVKKTRGSLIEVVSGPAELGFPLGEQLGAIPQFEAVDKLGNTLSFNSIVSGDLLRIAGSQDEFSIEEVQNIVLVLEQGLPSNIEGVGFEIRSLAAKDHDRFNQLLETYTTSPNLLPKNNFDENLDAIDIALTRALLPGQNFASNRNQARIILAQLLSILTDSPRRSDEYTIPIPTAALNLESILASYVVEAVTEVDSLIDSFNERKYTRASLLLTTARIEEFYDTTEETGSFSGGVLHASKLVDADLPAPASSAYVVGQETNLATSSGDSPDADKTFGDTEDLLDISE